MAGGGAVQSVELRKPYPVKAADYKLLEEIGHGISAIVYRALCLPYNEVVAIKALDLEKCKSDLDAVRREAVTMTLINHPNAVKAYCSFVVEQSLWVVMPYMAEGSCLHIMKTAFADGFEEAAIATFLKEALKALEYLHRHDHIHRDVKAGNILVDGNGAVKLADFGVSACMFESGERQRSRNTFTGTPCWMAPEVMEQLHGYDFKADIWSFGITALELAHGHAPFAKYPPAKVLLMTVHNTPPILDHKRDKVRFSKSFKEMIAMCLVKDPTKRPTAEKLLRHLFFKQARSADYIRRHILVGLPLLGEQYNYLKDADTARLAQLKMKFDEIEERSQTEYKIGVSSWNFNVDDLKAQPTLTAKEGDESPESAFQFHPPQRGHLDFGCPNRAQLPVSTTHSLKVETENDNGCNSTAPCNYPASKPAGRSDGTCGRKEPKHIGRFDVFEDDNDLESADWHDSPPDSPRNEHRRGDEREPTRKEREERNQRKFDKGEDQKEQEFSEDKERNESRKSFSGPLTPERVLSSGRGRDEDRDRDHPQGGRSGDRGSFSGPLLTTGDRPGLDHRPANGGPDLDHRAANGGPGLDHRPANGGLGLDHRPANGGPSSDHRPANGVHGISRSSSGTVTKDGLQERLKGPAQKVPVLQKGRFSVTTDSEDLEGSNQLNGAAVPAGAIVSQLQSALQLAIKQQDTLTHILSDINPSEVANSMPSCNALKRNSSVNAGRDYSMVEMQSEREADLLRKIAELQSKNSQLQDENQALKKRNSTLERQLNAIFNKEEEERIRKEEAAKEDR